VLHPYFLWGAQSALVSKKDCGNDFPSLAIVKEGRYGRLPKK